MLSWTFIFVVVAMVTALFGQIGMAAARAGFLGALVYLSLALLALALVEGVVRCAQGGLGRKQRTPWRHSAEAASPKNWIGGIMRATLIIGILLIVFGLVSLIYQGITYTEREEVLDIGPIEATTETRKTIPLPPIVGGVALAAGVTLVVLGRKP